MKEIGFQSKQLIELLREDYQLEESIIIKHLPILNDEINAFKIILYLINIETSLKNRENIAETMHNVAINIMETFHENPDLDLLANYFANLFSSNK